MHIAELIPQPQKQKSAIFKKKKMNHENKFYSMKSGMNDKVQMHTSIISVQLIETLKI